MSDDEYSAVNEAAKYREVENEYRPHQDPDNIETYNVSNLDHDDSYDLNSESGENAQLDKTVDMDTSYRVHKQYGNQ